jgi:hypothetical protein
MFLSFSWMDAWTVLFGLLMLAGYSVVGVPVFRRFGSIALIVYWLVVTFSFTGGCIWALGGGTLLGVLTFLPIMLGLVGLPTGLALLQMVRHQQKNPQISSGRASTFLFLRTLLLVPVGILASYAVNVAENLLRMAIRG